MAWRHLASLLLLLASTLALAVPTDNHYPRHGSCRCFPGDSCWPTAAQWSQFNATVGGRLIATIPIGSPCHNDPYAPYNAAQCQALQAAWLQPATHYTTSSSVMAPFARNYSCDPFTPQTAQCVIGTYVQYAVNVNSIQDVQTTIAFTQQYNIRLVIRNTGHDYFGKSTGAGAVALWTHNLKSTQVVDWKSSAYTGKALTVSAGIQVSEAQQAAHNAGLVVVGGNSPSVGVAGGYTQGGGHGPLASYLGLGADQTLQWQVITSDGKFLTATPTQNSDLYYALSGGGGGTYGVVWSLTVRAHSDFPTAASNLTFTNAGVSQTTYYSVISTFLQSLPAIVDSGAVCIWLLANTTFLIQPTTAPGQTVAQLQKLMNPTINALKANNMPYQYYINQFPTYLDSYTAMNPEPQVTEYSIGGRLIPRSLVATNATTQKLVSALQYINDNGGVISGVSVNVAKFGQNPSNAANPVWRSTLFDAVVGVPWLENNPTEDYAGQTAVTNNLLPQLENLTPNGGAYLNEGDIHQPNWQYVFYNNAYQRLLSIKQKYDKSDTWYGLTAVGSESWTQQPDGRLCAS